MWRFLTLMLALAGCDRLDIFSGEALTWRDASLVMHGICFEAADDAAGQVFVLRSAAELEAFYDLADQSELCRRPVTRQPFDFEGRVLAGLWSQGVGCQAAHEVIGLHREASTLTLTLRFVTSGDCAYELVRPFWAALPAGYDVVILAEP